MTVADTIHRKLTAALSPSRLEIIDDSGRHQGHAGAHPEGESHFSVTVVAAAFDGLARVARHRLVYSVLAEELEARVHALRLKTLTPSEDA